MHADLVSIGLGFIEGLGLVLSPCILPIIPILFAGSLNGSPKRTVGIMLGFSIFFAVVVYFSRQLVIFSGIHLDIFRNIAYGILIILGIIMLSTRLSELFSRLTQGLGRVGSIFSNNNNPQQGFLNGLLFGGLVALIWTPCAGPILAAVLVQVILQKESIIGFFTLISFALGAVLPIFLVAYYGNNLLSTVQFLKPKAVLIRKLLGVILIVNVIYLVYFSTDLSSQAAPNSEIKVSNSLVNGLLVPYPEPKIEGISSWINSQPLSLSDLKGKVVLVDFWTYSCINCIRTLPYVKDWYKKYHDQGFEIIGIHSPEFDFERDLANVQRAVKKLGILYPVALDNQLVTWRNFKNQYWPAHYLINKQGEVVYTHFGEGHYDTTESNIRFLLGMKNLKLEAGSPESVFAMGQTPETYLGYERADPGHAPKLVANNSTNYYFPKSLGLNAWALNGEWESKPHYILATKENAQLQLHFAARKVYMVMGNAGGKSISVKLLLNGVPLEQYKGKDVNQGLVQVDHESIYEVVSLPEYKEATLEIIATEPGLKVYTFTFGN